MNAVEGSLEGLSGKEAAVRLGRFGANKLPEGKRRGPLMRLLLQFHNVLIYVLLAAAVVTALLGHWMDTAVILAVVVINALIGFIQEGKAEKALDSIKGMLSLQATVLRDGEEKTVAAGSLVPGDIVLLQSGDKTPADIRLLKNRSLRVEEAALTGESVPVDKSTEAVEPGASLGDRKCMAYSGTLIAYGQARGVVVATGAKTELGRINEMLATAEELTTPLLKQIAAFGKVLTYVILGIGFVTFLIGYFLRGYPLGDIFLAVVGLAVAAIPEGLPAILTITLAIGVQAMARRKAIIRRLPAVETLGSVSVICSDKTGTLTRNEMTAVSVVTGGQLYEITGVGYQPEGRFSQNIEDVSPTDQPVLYRIARIAMLCNDSRLREVDGQWVVEGDPTEGALLALAGKAGLKRKVEEGKLPRRDSIPFDSEHKYMATLHEQDGGRVIFLKGAPERVLDRCSHQLDEDGEEVPLDKEHWGKVQRLLASKGQRLLALAAKRAEDSQDALDFDDVREGFVMYALLGLIDPPRDEAITAIRSCHEAGIEVKMITGDHALTAGAIGKQIGLRNPDEVVSGDVLEKTSDEDLPEIAARVNIFARTSPEHKLRLVKALQSRGHIVAMTGDGVNDAPALKTANVGVAMGIKGTEAAKEASEMVLADDNFASIAHAVEEGRTVYDNIKKSILFILPTNGAQAMVIIMAIILGMTVPLTPVQVLWVNMITAVTLALSLAFEPAEPNVMRRPPRNAKEPIVPLFFLWRVGFVSVLIMIGSMLVFQWKINSGDAIELARTAAVNTLILGQVFYLLNSRFIYVSSWRHDILTANPYVLYTIGLILLAQMLFTYSPLMQTWFGTAALPLIAWFPMLLLGMFVFVAIETEKWILRKKGRKA